MLEKIELFNTVVWSLSHPRTKLLHSDADRKNDVDYKDKKDRADLSRGDFDFFQVLF